jgi:hypothetical protein
MLSPAAGHRKHRRAKKARARQRSRFGFATAPFRPRPANGQTELEPALDPGRQASEGELADLELRRGKANGRG